MNQLALFMVEGWKGSAKGWYHSASAPKGIAYFTAMIRCPNDPERSPRPKGGQKDRSPHLTLKKLSWVDMRQFVYNGLAKHGASTINRLAVLELNLTADVLMGSGHFDEALWGLVEAGWIEHTNKAPIKFRVRDWPNRCKACGKALPCNGPAAEGCSDAQ